MGTGDYNAGATGGGGGGGGGKQHSQSLHATETGFKLQPDGSLGLQG